MGTNYYARILPSKKRKNEIKKAIDDNDFYKIKHLIDQTYGRPYMDYDGTTTYCGGEIHLGKCSCGWKFLWNPNWYKLPKGHIDEKKNDKGIKSLHWVDDGYDIFKYYDLTKKSIKAFIDREDVEIYNEYGEKQDKKEFYEMAMNWGYDKDDEGWDGDSYEEWEKKQDPNYTSRSYKTDYCGFLTELGFKLNKNNTDFYSDGMRFSTCTEFS